MLPEFWTAASKLKKGEYTTEPVKTQYGWHVIELTDRRMKTPPKYEEVKDQVKEELKRDLITAWLAELRKTAKVREVQSGRHADAGSAGPVAHRSRCRRVLPWRLPTNSTCRPWQACAWRSAPAVCATRAARMSA